MVTLTENSAPISSPPAPTTVLRGKRLAIAYAIWLPLLILAIVTAVAVSFAQAAEIFGRPFPVCVGPTCGPFGFTPRDIEVIRELRIPKEFGYAYRALGSNLPGLLLSLGILGVVLWRRRTDWMAMLLSFTLIVITGTFIIDSGASLLRIEAWRLPVTLAQHLGIGSLAMLMYTFPNGRFVPRWTRFLPFVFILPIVVTILFFRPPSPEFRFIDTVIFPLVVTPILLVSGIIAQIYRYYRVSDPIQRQQTKWLLFGLFIPVVLLIVWMFFAMVFPQTSSPARVYFILGFAPVLMVASLLFPLSVVISIMRYRLWDIAIVVNKTLVYGALTSILAGMYVGGILLIQWALKGMTDQGGSVAIVVSTLGVAALFQPLRRHVQIAIDQRFYRGKYDAARTLTAFSVRMRDEVDLDMIRGETMGVVTKTLQPAYVSLWLRESSPTRFREQSNR